MSTPSTVEARVQRRMLERKIDIAFLFYEAKTGDRCVAKPLEFENIGDDYVKAPTVTLRDEMAQQLMDELWAAGLRPTEGTGSAGSLAATERHLKDMQTITMGLLRGEF